MTARAQVRRPLAAASLTAAAFAAVLILLALVGAQIAAATEQSALAEAIKAKGYRRSGIVERTVTGSRVADGAFAPAAPASGFTTQIRLGHQSGDGWEPAIAADRFGHVYMLYAQYLGVPGCADCMSPTQILQVSNDRGVTWGKPTVIQAVRQQGWDSQIVVDPVDGKTVYATWIERYKSDVIVAKSTDFGVSWSHVTANVINRGADKPILAVRGNDVYVAYNHSTQMFVSSSHDGGRTFIERKVNANAKLGWALAGGGTVDPSGNAYFIWAGYEQNGVAKGPVNLFISKSSNGGDSWGNTVLDVSGDPRNCSVDKCGWAYLGAAGAMTSDASGAIYALWNAGPRPEGPNRIWFARSTDAGRTWSPKRDVSGARAGAEHAFPAIAARGSGDVRISWMDSRVRGDNTLWNTYYRASSNGGGSWSAEQDVSSFVGGVEYIKQDGYEFPFGDYYELDIDDRGTAHIVNGQALNYDTPGAVWYTRGN